MTFKVKDGLIVGNNTFVNSTLDVNANNISVSNTVSVGSGKVNSSFFTGTANNAIYAFGGKSESSLNANSATYATNAQFAYTANVANYLNGKAESALAANSSLYANYATYAGIANVALYSYGGKAETALNANSATYATNSQFAYTANVANYLNGKAESALAANSALYANYATYAGIANTSLYSYGGKAETALNANSSVYATNAQFAYVANVANYLNGKAETALDANSATYATNAQFAYVANVALYSYGGKAETALNANSALYANVANYLNGKAESALAANSALYANVANYLNGKAESALDANTALYANVANYLNGKAESALAANSALYANVANYLNGKAESALAANSALYANVANYLNGKAESALDANTAQYLGGFNSAYYTNATNLSTGTVAEPRLPFRMNQNVRTTDSVEFRDLVVTGNVFFSGNATLIQTNQIATVDSLIYLNNALTANVTNASGNGSFVTYVANNTFVAGESITIEGMNPSSYNIYSANNLTIATANATQFTVSKTTTDSFVSGGIAYAKAALNPDVGFVAGLTANDVYQHVGFFRDATDGIFKAFDGLIAEPDGPFIDLANARIADIQANTIYAATAYIGNGSINSSLYSGTANNATYAYGKQENQLYVANAVFATTANNSLRLNGKQESQLYVANAVFATTSNNSLYAFGKQENQLYVANAVFATTANNSLYAFGKQESQLSVANSVYSNNSAYLNGFTSSYFTNATNISTGTLSWSVMPTNSVNTSSAVAVSNTWTFQDIIINGGIKVQNSFGNTNQVLASNGTGGLYWKQDVGTQYFIQTIANTNFGVIRLRDANNVNTDVVLVGNGTSQVFSNSSYVVINTQDQFVGTVTSIDSGPGLVGGPITDNGTIYVGAGAGISVNQDDVAVNAKDGLVANSSGLWVNTYYFSILSSEVSSNNAFYLQYKTWEAPGSIGNTTPNDGKFLNLQANTLWVKTNVLANGYIWVNGTTINSTYFPASANNAYRAFGKFENQLNVNSAAYTTASNNASYLNGYNWDSPPKIGETTANTGKFTYANVSSHVAFGTAAHMTAIGKITVSGTSPANIIEFPTSIYSGGKLIIEVTDTHTNFRHISELLLSHDNTKVSATEYGVVQTGNTALATFNTDILSGNVRILATPISSNTTTFKIIQNLFLE